MGVDAMLAVAVLSVAIATIFPLTDGAPGCGVMTPADCGADGCGESKPLLSQIELFHEGGAVCVRIPSALFLRRSLHIVDLSKQA